MNLFYFDQKATRNIYFNLSIEESISLCLTSSDFIGGIRFWKNENSIVLGLSEKIKDCVKEEVLFEFQKNFHCIVNQKSQIKNSIFIARRASGGGTVFHDLQSNLNYSVFISLKNKPELYPVKNSYEKILALVSLALQKQNIESAMEGKSDLVIFSDGLKKKISGNAQFRKKDCIVHHGTILLNQDIIAKISTILPHPKEEPDYRKNRNHKNFMTSLPLSFSEEKFKKDFFLLFTEFMGGKIEVSRAKKSQTLTKDFQKVVLINARNLFNKKYTNKEFIFGESE